MAEVASHGFWGKPTASIDWCETNYEVTHYIAEFYNTISNVFLVGFSLLGVHMCLKEKHSNDLLVLYALIGVIGVGSAAFHGTLLDWAQQLDETPMIYLMVQWAYCLYRPVMKWTDGYFWPALIIAHNLIFTIAHAVTQSVLPFQLYFVGWVLLGALRLVFLYNTVFKQNKVVQGLIKSYIFIATLGACFWLFDQHFCHEIKTNLLFNPQGHAIWHFCCGLSCYVGPASLGYYLAKLRGQNPDVSYKGGILPYVHIIKQKQ